MSSINLFQAALDSNETEFFFKGKGKYFFPDRDWGGHLYVNHYGWVSKFIRSSKENKIKFLETFEKFAKSLDLKIEDIEHFFGNLLAVAYVECRGDFKFDLESLGDSGRNFKNAIVDYIISLKNSKTYSENKELIDLYIVSVKDGEIKRIVDEALFV